MSQRSTTAAETTERDENHEKRKRFLTRKALQNAIASKREKLCTHARTLQDAVKNLQEEQNADAEQSLDAAMKRYEEVLYHLTELYQQDQHGDFPDEADLTEEYQALERARNALVGTAQAHPWDTRSRGSQRTTSSRSSSSSTARRNALADVAAAKRKAEFDKAIAEKERLRRVQEAEEQRTTEEKRAQHERDMAVLVADRTEAIAEARLQAIEESIKEEDELIRITLDADVQPQPLNEDLVRTWMNAHPITFPTPAPRQVPSRRPIAMSTPKQDHTTTPKPAPRHTPPTQVASIPKQDLTVELLETFTTTNQRLVSGLSKQSLPKCHPDIFLGDVTLFHPWKRSFQAMIDGSDVTPAQEMNYLRNFTGGEVQNVVDNFRRRHHADLTVVLRELWTELERRFGNTAAITNTLLERLTLTAKFGDGDLRGLQVFADLCGDVDSQLSYLPGLRCLNYPNVIRPIVEELPPHLRTKWEKEIVTYATKHHEAYPDFHAFASMVQEQARKKNHPNVQASGVHVSSQGGNTPKKSTRSNQASSRRVMKTRSEETDNDAEKRCTFHNRDGHTLTECRAFDSKPIEEKTEWVMKERLCFRCLEPNHIAKECESDVKCDKCGSDRHPSILHAEKDGEVTSSCTSLCGTRGTSCSKIVLVDVFHENRPEEPHQIYAIIDDQSNASMITPDLATKLKARGSPERYLLSTCSGEKTTNYGRRVPGILIRANNHTSKLPTLVECAHIPQDKAEIPTPEIARRFDHLKNIANEIPPLNEQAKIQLLIGRDAPELMKVRASKNGPKGMPWAQKLDLGWTISGQVCLNRVGGPVHISARRTTIWAPDQTPHASDPTTQEFEMSTCPNLFEVKERYGEPTKKEILNDVFHTTEYDNEVDMSLEDNRFLRIMEEGIHKNERGNWVMPLPFRSPHVSMPNNRKLADSRLRSLLRSLGRKPQMKKDYLDFLGKVIEKGHAVPVPAADLDRDPDSGHIWYLPHFGVYHPRKPSQIRVVFDASAEYEGTSLNKELLTGPDLTNSLFGVLLRFRHHDTAVMCDVEQMFHSFNVDPKHQSFLRFLWFKDNNPSEDIIEYQMTVHLFGNGPSPAVATYGLRKTALDGEEKFGKDTRAFIHKNFYVDDGLGSRPTPGEAIALIKAAQETLATANIRLHKVTSNSVEVMEALPPDDRAKDVRDLDLRKEILPSQRSLGVQWDLQEDQFTFDVTIPNKPFTRRGVLSVVNSIYDPLGIAVPITLKGKLLLQKLVAMGKTRNNSLGWDDPLPDSLARQWQQWKESLVDLEKVSLPRCLHPKNFGRIARAEIHAFSDASEEAIGVVIYSRLLNERGEAHVSFLFGQSRVAPTKPTSIPRLELCGAVLSTQAVRKVLKEIDMDIHEVFFYTDSQVVLGYIQNDARRFYSYVANRVQIIRNVSKPEQWNFIDTSSNPADLATRGIDAAKLGDSQWLDGPRFLKETIPVPPPPQKTTAEEYDPEVRVIVNSTRISTDMRTSRFSRFSTWASLRRAIATLIAKVQRVNGGLVNDMRDASKSGDGRPAPTVEELDKATTVLVKMVQSEAFSQDIEVLNSIKAEEDTSHRKAKSKKDTLKASSLRGLDPFIDDNGILRVGGRLRRSTLDFTEKHPAILPKNHHLSELIIRHYHDMMHHQGRQITHGSVRQAGYWVISGHSAVSRVINSCVICKKARGKMMSQHMADLPTERTEPSAPFTSVGLDVFGPWLVRVRKLRGGAANSKRWGLVFTCLSSRAVHIELLEAMDASSFICALRRFFAIRGTASTIRCDRGTNFVGGKSDLDKAISELDQEKIQRYTADQGCKWVFNPPHASHFGGVWERQIRTIRSILDAMLTQIGSSQLTHELLSTLMAEVTGIVNSRPISCIPSDIDDAQPLSPAMLLTMKTRPLTPPPGDFVPEDLYARQWWRRAQYLADQFWIRWRREYLQNQQRRLKWHKRETNLACGDIVLIKDIDAHRNNWPVGKIINAIKSEDGNVRKAEVLLTKGGKKKILLRPISQLVHLMST